MTASHFTILLKSRFPDFAWPWVVAALRQDSIIWDTLENTSLGSRALADLPNRPEEWTPAALALLALEIQPADELQAIKAGEPLPKELRLQVDQLVGDWQEPTIETPTTFLDAGLLALALRETFLAIGSWEKVFTSFANATSQLAIACLYGFVEDEKELLQALLKNGEGAEQVVHILLCQPLPPETLLNLFTELLEDVGTPCQVKTLDYLNAQRPDLAQSIAQQVFDYLPAAPVSLPAAESSLEGQLQNFTDLVYNSTALRLSNQASKAVPVLAEAMKSVRRIEAQAASQLAQTAAEQGDHKTSIEAWKQAAQLAPDNPYHLAGLVGALIEAGLTREARVFLSARQSSVIPSDHPVLLLSASRLARLLDKEDTSRHLAAKSLSRIDPGYAWLGTLETDDDEKGTPDDFPFPTRGSKQGNSAGEPEPGLTTAQHIQLAQAFLEVGMPYEAARTAGIVLQKSPSNRPALAITTQAQLRLGHPAVAMTAAAAALAQQNDDIPLRRQFVESLEAVGEWEAALKERLFLMEQVETSGVEMEKGARINDLCALAHCSLMADQPNQAFRACQVALELDPADGKVIFLLGKAHRKLGNLSSALDHFKKATEIIPSEADAWLELVSAYQQSDDELKAVEALRTASQAAPDSAEIQLAMGEAYLAEEAPTQALAALRKAAALVASKGLPGKTARHTIPGRENVGLGRRIAYHLGQTLHLLGYLEESKQVLGEAYDDDRRSGAPDPQIAYAYAKTLLSLQTPDAALAPLQVVVQADPVLPDPYLEYARALLATSQKPNDAREARMYLQKVLAITGRPSSTPSEPGGAKSAVNDTQPLRAGNKALRDEARSLLAEALYKSGDLDEAMQAYRIALETPLAQQTSWRTRLSVGLARTALALGQHETAIAILQETFQADPLSPETHVVLSEAYQTAGLVEEAYQAAQSARRLNPADVETLAWYARQLHVLHSLPRGRHIPADSEAMDVLNQATRIAPFRTDLLAELGQIQMKSGNEPAAHETLARLALAVSTQDGPSSATPAQFYKAAHSLRQIGDARRAISVLEYAASLQNPVETGGVDLPDLLSELAEAYREDGNPAAALEQLEQAIHLQPKSAKLYLQKADLLVGKGAHQEALQQLQSAMQYSPDQADLYTRTAEVLQATGDIPAALKFAEKAILVTRPHSLPGESNSVANQPENGRSGNAQTPPAGEEQNSGRAASVEDQLPASCLAAHLAYTLLDGGRARMLLIPVERLINGEIKPSRSSQLLELVHAACLLAEIEFEDGNFTAAAHALEPFRAQSSVHPRVLAAQSRLAASQGDIENGNRLFEAAMATQNSGATTRSNYYSLWTLRSLAATALELGQWEIAMPLLESLQHNAENEPLSHLQMAHAVVVRAEAQFVCQELDVVTHAPGGSALSEQAVELFNAAIEKIQIPDCPLVTRWKARGQAIFHPDAQTAQALEAAANSPDEFAALVTCYGRTGDLSAAARTAQLFPLHPRVQLALAIALASTNPRQAYSIASGAAAAANQDCAGLELAPLLYALQARLAIVSGSRAGEIQDALTAIEAALRIWPDEPRWHALAARINLGRSASGPSPDFAPAIHHLGQATRLEPKHSDHYLAMGHVQQASGDLHSAIQSFEQASRLAPDQPAGWMALARALQLSGDEEQAAASADRAIECDPESIEPLMLRGELALSANNARGAQSRAQAILKIHPDHPQGLYLLARALRDLERPDEAMQVLKKAILLTEQPLPLRLEQTRLLAITEGPEAALEMLKELAEQYMDEPTVLSPLADALLEAGNTEAAVQAARLALHANQGDLSIDEVARMHYLIGSSQGRSGQLDQAVHHLGEAIQYRPGYLEAYLELGHAQQERRQFVQALNAYQQAIAIAPDDPRPYYQAGLSLKENKDYLGAESMLRKAAELAPNEVTIHRLLAAVVALNLVHSRRQPTNPV